MSAAAPGSKKRIANRSQLVRLFGMLFAVGLLLYLLSQQGWQEIKAAFSQIPAWRLWLALALMMVSRFAVAARWYMLLRAAEVPAGYRQALRLTFAGLFASNFLPTTVGGDLVRLVGAIRMQYDPVVSASSLIVDRLIGMAGMALVAPFSLPALAGTMTASAGLPFAVATAPSLWERVRAAADRSLRRVWAALQLWIKRPEALLQSLLFTGVNMLCLFSVIDVLLTGMGQDMPLWLIGGLYSLVYFVTLAPISFNGYGVQEISMTLIFSNLGRAPQATGLTIALLFRTVMMLASLPGAFFLPDILAAAHHTPEEPQ